MYTIMVIILHHFVHLVKYELGFSSGSKNNCKFRRAFGRLKFVILMIVSTKSIASAKLVNDGIYQMIFLKASVYREQEIPKQCAY